MLFGSGEGIDTLAGAGVTWMVSYRGSLPGIPGYPMHLYPTILVNWVV